MTTTPSLPPACRVPGYYSVLLLATLLPFAQAGAISFQFAEQFREVQNLGGSDLTINPFGVPVQEGEENDVLVLDTVILDDGGDPVTDGVTVTVQNSERPGTEFELTPFDGGPLFDDGFGNELPFETELTSGVWTFTATDGVEEIETTVGPETLEKINLVSDVSISGSALTPTIDWTNPAGFPDMNDETVDRIRVGIIDNDTGSEFFRTGISPGTSALPGDETSFTFPEGVIPGPGDFTVRILPERFEPDPFSDFTRSSFFVGHRVPTENGGDVQLPRVILEGPTFEFDVAIAEAEAVFIDPEVAVGYDYAIGLGNPRFASVVLPELGDNLYELFLFNGTEFVFEQELSGGVQFFFGDGGIERFRILGIEPSLGLDPLDPVAFVTQLTFTDAGRFTGTMTPIKQSVPEPATVALVLLGIGLAGVASGRGTTRQGAV